VTTEPPDTTPPDDADDKARAKAEQECLLATREFMRYIERRRLVEREWHPDQYFNPYGCGDPQPGGPSKYG